MIAKTIRTCFPIAAAAVSDKAEEINKLNVFPVPDGDTGTNMSLTLASVTKELSALPADADMEAIAGAMGHYGQWENAAKYIDPRTDEETHTVANVFPVHE